METSAPQSVVCRSDRSMLSVGFLLLASGAGYMAIPLSIHAKITTGDLVFLAPLISPVVLAFAFCVLHYLRYRLIADETGVRWRRALGGWRSITWDEISDYYLITARSKSSPGLGVLITSRGRFPLPADITRDDSEAFRQYVKTHAHAAKAQDWDVLGTRRTDPFPQTFRYWNKASPWKFAIFASVITGLYAAAIVYTVHQLVDLGSQLGWQQVQFLLWGTVLFFLACTWVPLGFFQMYFQLWKRRGEQITVSPEEVRYENTLTDTRLSVTWNEVSDYFYGKTTDGQKEHYVLSLRGTGERQITWNSLLVNSSLLVRIVQKYAPAPVVPTDAIGWRTQSAHEKTGGSDPATWQSGAVGIGGRVFRYQTPTITFLLWLGSILTAFCLIDIILTRQSSNLFLLVFFIASCLFCGIPTLYGLICMLFTRTETDDVGITKYTIMGKQHLYWYTVADYQEKKDRITVHGKNGACIICGSAVNGYKELKREIERYAPPPQTGWEKKP